MEITYQVIGVAVGTFILWRGLVLIHWYRSVREILNSPKVKTIGPSHPIWGHLHLFRDFTELFDRMKDIVVTERDTRLIGLWLSFYPIIYACHPDTAKSFIMSTEMKPKHLGGVYNAFLPVIGNGLLLKDGVKWRRHRRLLNPIFRNCVLQEHIKVFNGVTETLISKFRETPCNGGSIEISNAVAMMTLDAILRSTFSYEDNIQEIGEKHPFVEAVTEVLILISDRMMKPWQFFYPLYRILPSGRRSAKYTKVLHNFSRTVIENRRKEQRSKHWNDKNTHDFIELMIAAKDEKGVGLTDDEINEEVDTFMIAGYETTKSLISWAIYALAKHQVEQQRVYQEVEDVMKERDNVEWSDLQNLPFITAFLKETLRVHNPVPGIMRHSDKPTEVDGLIIPPGVQLGLGLSVIHTNPSVWPDCKEFRPDRFLLHKASSQCFDFLPFSAGSRNCIGQGFAMVEAMVAVVKIVKTFKIMPDENHVPKPNVSVTIQSLNGIKVKLQKRN